MMWAMLKRRIFSLDLNTVDEGLLSTVLGSELQMECTAEREFINQVNKSEQLDNNNCSGGNHAWQS